MVMYRRRVGQTVLKMFVAPGAVRGAIVSRKRVMNQPQEPTGHLQCTVVQTGGLGADLAFQTEAVLRMHHELMDMHTAVDSERFSVAEVCMQELYEVYGQAVRNEAVYAGSRQLRVWLAMVGGQAAGYALAEAYEADLLTWSPANVYVHDIFAYPQFRNLRIGCLLMDAAAVWAAELGIKQVRALTMTDNATARERFVRMGYRPCAVELIRKVN